MGNKVEYPNQNHSLGMLQCKTQVPSFSKSSLPVEIWQKEVQMQLEVEDMAEDRIEEVVDKVEDRTEEDMVESQGNILELHKILEVVLHS